MKKILLPIFLVCTTQFAIGQNDSSYHTISDTLKKVTNDTIRIGNMLIVNDKNNTGSYEMGHGLVKINLNDNDKGYRKTTKVAKKEKSDNRNASLYIKSFKDTLLTIHNDTVQLGRLQIINKDEAEYNKDLGAILDGDFKKTKITFDRSPRRLKNISTNWWIFDLGFANYQDNTENKTKIGRAHV